VDEGPVSLELENYVNSVLGVPLEDYSLKYDPANNTFVKSERLSRYTSGRWYFLKDFKLVATPPGIYQFLIGSDSYIGSTKDLFKRCFIQHKNHAFTHTNKHKLFYNKVVSHGWKSFNLNILSLVPNHVRLFAEHKPDYIMTERDLLILLDLTSYELTIAEQLHLDYYKPTLNVNHLANWSTYNTGATGYIRSDELNDEISLSFLNRSFTEYTKELHRKNNTGKKLSELTKAKISKGHGGLAVNLVNVNSNNAIVEFKTNTLLSKELNISLRTVNRWLDDNKIHSTRSLKYPRVKIMSCLQV
jgi:group I intron endonuclease